MKKKTNRTYIGGQAVIQGVMMRGRRSMVTVVRDDEGTLHTEARRLPPPEEQKKWRKVPFLRGVVNFVTSLVDGTRILMRSAEVVLPDEEEQPQKSEKKKVSSGALLSTVSTLIGVVLAVALFLVVPQVITNAIAESAPVLKEHYGIYKSLIEGGFRLVVFFLYILFTLCFKSLRETYMYHGAEHKTINCHEYGLPLTTENVRGCTRMHDRCGTTFLFIVMFISILIFALVSVPLNMLYAATPLEGTFWTNIISFFVKLLCLPIVAGVSYEVLKLLAKTDSPLVLPLKAPGFLLQKLTTREPTDDMIECAILAFEGVEKMDADPDLPERFFPTEIKLSKLSEMMKNSFARQGIDGSDAEWILSLTLKIPRSALSEERILTRRECSDVLEVYNARVTGRPLWYIYGDADFYGRTFQVDERVLIPRPETEILAEQAIRCVTKGARVLDLCTGSGAVGITVACETGASVVLADISADALEVARCNAERCGAAAECVQSDLFANISGVFDVITANPPYVRRDEIPLLPRDVRDFEPHLALDGGEDGLKFYRAIAREAPAHLSAGGVILVECGEGQAQSVAALFREAGLCDTKIFCDLAGCERVVKAGPKC